MDENLENDNRIELRRHLLLYLDVVDLRKNESIAKLGDINSSGILLLLKSKLNPGDELHIAVNIPESLKLGRNSIELHAVVRWCRKAAKPGMYEAGCSFKTNDVKDPVFIEELIKRIGFSDGTRRIFLQNEENVFKEI